MDGHHQESRLRQLYEWSQRKQRHRSRADCRLARRCPAPDTVLTGLITPDGRIQPVASLPSKLEGAARANMRVMLIPAGQGRTDEWNLFELARERHITIIEVGTLDEAYEFMSGRRP
jgi:predicted S18 family serine protease